MKWEIVDRSLIYQGFFRLEALQIRHSLYAGGWSGILRRELFQRSDAVAVLPYDPVRDQVLLIEQFRIGAVDAPHGPWLIEIVAGSIEPGERHEDVAHREAREEAGCELSEPQHVCDYFSSPGAFHERVSVYVARADLSRVAGVHGLREEGEDIRVFVVNAQAAFDMVAAGVIISAMPIVAIQWLQIHYERIREQWT